MPDDADAILVTMMLKKLNPNMTIVARCNDPEYVEKIYRAGADYVFDLPSIASEVITTTVLREHAAKRLFYEGYVISKYRIDEDAPIVGKSSRDLSGVLVLGIEKDGKVMKSVDKIEPGMNVIVAGRKEDLLEFEKKFMSSKQ